MTREEYSLLFHQLQLNRVAFKRLLDCDDEVLKLVNSAIAAEREECAKLCDGWPDYNVQGLAEAIRARGKNERPKASGTQQADQGLGGR